ncbi:Efflux transporter, RND family, MFP subunit [Paraburkholderia piptadeniae]|uniref:Efflux transporter, RND family, MFP subunit n=1 Tax=Paraburkholderia piptadeniae TaxID=1701573 RepID=A0A1N7SKC8_9BURK|nr:efflux RND transporter periplasmic adaptor subunit [Paraburkholderia piptadeniae]SIT47861.1 Efflux transporter, RND family, MFP subunit [Paraburkholderia piptadeniae]
MRNNRTWLYSGLVTAGIAAVLSVYCPSSHADEAPVTTVQTVTPTRGTIAQPVHAYGVVASSSSSVTTVDLPYVARIDQMRVQAGQAVKRGTPLFVVQADPAAVVAATQAKSAAQLAQDELARTQSLYDKSLATQSQLASARKAALDAKQALDAQRQLGIGTGHATIVAPHDGVVTQVSVAQGDQVQAGSAILQLSAGSRGDNARPNVTLGVEPADAASIHPGDTVTVSGLSTALQTAHVAGRVAMVGASIDTQSQLVNIGASVPFGQSAFMPGTRVKADIATQSGTYWIVPRSAVLNDAHGDYVFQTGSDNKAHRVTVKKVVEDGDRYGVDGTLDATRPLVVVGNYELQDGTPVHIDGTAQQATGPNAKQGTAR